MTSKSLDTLGLPMVYRGSKPREAKLLFVRRESTLEDKLRRHKNKKRIWRRCVAQLQLAALNNEATTLEMAS
jgi:hypothetical protein